MECWKCKYYSENQYENSCDLLEEQYFIPYYGESKCEVVDYNGEIVKEKYDEWFKYK